MAADRRARLPDIAALLREVQALYRQLQERAAQAKPKIQTYTVVIGDYLWKISGKPDIYADPYQWMRIYTYNKDQIKDPDLIHPEQIFKIQREVGPNEYLVVKGDWLGKIASNPDIYSDPTKNNTRET